MLCANFVAERKAFQKFLDIESNTKILLFCGQSGSGKTTLISACLREMPSQICHSAYTFRAGASINVAEVFFRAGTYIGWDELPTFNRQVNLLCGILPIQIEKNYQVGSNNSISMALYSESTLEQQERIVLLTNAWFSDINRCNHSILIVFDGYEKAPKEVQDWISGPFLERAAHQKCLRVLIAGQETPEPKNIEWGDYCEYRELLGIEDADHWEPIIEAMGRYIPTNGRDPKAWLAGVCYALHGNPSAIMKIVESLPRKVGI